MSDTWTATYMRYGTQYETEFDSLSAAVGFAVNGTETWDYAVEHIVGPGGEVIEGAELGEAELHWQLGDDDYDRARAAKWGPRLAQEAP